MARGSFAPRLLIFLVILLLAAITTVGLLVLSADDDSVPVPVVSLGPSYTEGVVGTWRQINPLLAESEVDQDLVELVFRGLVSVGPNGGVRPELAQVPTVGQDGRTLTFRLNEGLRWSDGEDLDSADVAFTIRLVQAPDFRGDQTLAQAWGGVEISTPDELTVEVVLPHPNAPFVARFATMGILPEHLLEGTSGQALLESDFNTNPVGAGPYTIASLGSEEARLVVNPYFAGSSPQLLDLRMRFYRDQPAAVRAFIENEVDGLAIRGSVDETLAAVLEESSNAQAISIQRSLALILYLNNDNAILEEASVRRALALLIDRSILPWGSTQTNTTESASPVAPGSWAYDSEFDFTAPNLEEANLLLSEAGWLPHGTSGVLTRDGSEFHLTIRTDDDPDHVAVANAIALQLGAVGIRATVASTALNVLARDFLQERKYDAAVVTWDPGPDPDPYDAWHSSQLGSAGLNLANFADPVADQLIAYGRTHPEFSVRIDAYRQLQGRWIEVAPSIVLGYPSLTYLLHEDISASLPEILFSLSQRLSDIELWRR